MRILMVAPEYPPYGQGGGGVVSQVLSEKLAERGHTISVIAGCNQRLSRINSPIRTRARKIELIWIPLLGILETNYPQIQGSLPPTLQSLAYLKSIDYDQYDVIHLLAFGHLLTDYVNLVARSSKKILTIHAFPKYVEEGGKGGLPLKLIYKIYFKTLGRHTLDSPKIITTVSRFVGEDCIRRGVAQNKIMVVPNGIKLEKYQSLQYIQLEEKFQINTDDTLILSIARVVWHKGFEYAINAIHRVLKETNKPIKYMIIGHVEDLNYYSMLCRQIEKLGINKNVIFTGFISQDLKLQALTRADIFLAPSLHEGFGLTVLEAMALRKPIIASNCEGFQCILKHMRTALLVEPGKQQQIANAILTFLGNPEIVKRISNNAYHDVKKYNWKSVVTRYEELYQDI